MRGVAELINGKGIKEVETAILEELSVIRKLSLEQLPAAESRRDYSEELTEAYFQQFQKMPSASVLTALSDFLLLDYLKSPNKKNSDENQFHSASQEKYRQQKEIPVEQDLISFIQANRIHNFPQQRTTAEMEGSY